MAEGLKAMALEGHGIAFLPQSAVKKEVRARKLAAAAPAGVSLEMAMDVRAYREKPSARDVPKGTTQALWSYLVAHPVAP
jgi:DNA-binding transcriptional LysR family regulator